MVDIRCCLDWLEEQGYEHFGVLGTSLGSCYGFLASAHDARLRVNAFNHASTAFGDVVWAGQSTRHVREALDFEGNLKRRIVGREYWGVCDGLSLGAEDCEALYGEDLLVEDEAELPGGLVGNGFEAG